VEPMRAASEAAVALVLAALAAPEEAAL
jgi:hypothetical protein